MSGASAFSMSYGELEACLALMCDVDAASVRTRFRPLRLHDFPDAVQGGAGSRVRYDLPRILAYAAVFYLADGRLAQLAAMELVRSTWPEWCRALVAAAVETDVVRRPPAMPADAGPVLRIMPEGFTSRARPLTVALTGGGQAPAGPPVACRLEIDCRPVLGSLRSIAVDAPGLATAIEELERAFGWTPAEVPLRGEVGAMPPERGFIDDGPYFERALTFLEACEGRALTPMSRWRLGCLAAYLASPAPIDAWKREVGDDERKPRLHHLLAFRAEELGIPTRKVHPETMKACADVDVTGTARGLIAGAQAQRGLAVAI